MRKARVGLELAIESARKQLGEEDERTPRPKLVLVQPLDRHLAHDTRND
jgi:hypothetical protein